MYKPPFNVPNEYDANKQLGNWVKGQRGKDLYKKEVKSKKDLERIERLTNLRFVWKVYANS